MHHPALESGLCWLTHLPPDWSRNMKCIQPRNVTVLYSSFHPLFVKGPIIKFHIKIAKSSIIVEHIFLDYQICCGKYISGQENPVLTEVVTSPERHSTFYHYPNVTWGDQNNSENGSFNSVCKKPHKKLKEPAVKKTEVIRWSKWVLQQSRFNPTPYF